MKILITGCAKSGTTLLRRLFHAYNLNVCVNEGTINQLINMDYDVVKRTSNTIFSNKLKPHEIKKQRQLILDNNIIVINIVRDRVDVVRSENGYVTNERYDDCLLQFYNNRDIIDITVYFNELIEDPDMVQWDISKKLGLTPEFMWSDYPVFIDESKEVFTKNNYKLRRIGEKY
jgi:hypothetical protein